jgi:hypothetical protein
MSTRDPRDPFPPLPKAEALYITPDQLDLSRPFRFRGTVTVLGQVNIGQNDPTQAATTVLFVRAPSSHVNLVEVDGTLTDVAVLDVEGGVMRLGFQDLALSTYTQAIGINQDGTVEFPNNVWTTWTPTLTNMTLGNGSVVARYVKLGRTVHLDFLFTLGSSSAMGTAPKFTLPVAPSAAYEDVHNAVGRVLCRPDVGATSPGSGWITDIASTAALECFVWSTAAGTVANANITASVPGTWGTGGKFAVSATYEAAA